MYNERCFLTSRHGISLESLTCYLNQLIHLFKLIEYCCREELFILYRGVLTPMYRMDYSFLNKALKVLAKHCIS